ncbi:type III-A CRISPR-associated protein Cas10/Csm1 [Candidatus Hakubella thermalkaliphila]|uniref:CRISPR system single-strand-specific deoxyribonuclease Cas10/Csm1 (subtype III-A) n=1 Tax=Candidatus Hakubella thermalkaliphila TaxID=2754717 RepID=A0A6V8P6K5_9ACTN|nr:type III-A CRISPR-associated protein Cas10/Csm1 [Candidatus Hakubella thermalkaliphila]GFP27977.1 CRISPR-associated protein Csm1 [Candidatus Hakubella thermalkaliphila]GFP43041.1 CRISPR-associated protein Csm1 [Candidatus Hakubella thermalkaliphila]
MSENQSLSDYELLLYSALLHDIGKFAQRANVKCTDFDEFTEDDYGKSGAHSKWSASFVRNHLTTEFKPVISGILFHHKKLESSFENLIEKIVSRADHLSAGEREEAEELGHYKKIRLTPIFPQIFSNKDFSSTPKIGYRLIPLSTDIQDFRISAEEIISGEYEQLWDLFIKDIARIKNIKIQNFHHFHTLLVILKKHTWFIPSAVYKSIPDISLYDHLKSTCAVAAVIYKNCESKKSSELTEDFCLIGGDISGIQNFIYNIASPDESQKEMGKRIRGRSFYLSLLTESIAYYILRELDLPLTNLLWCGGGNFTILAYPTPKIEEIKLKLRSYLLEKYKGNLSLAIAETYFSGEEIINFSDKMVDLQLELDKAKLQKLNCLDWPDSKQLGVKICNICGIDLFYDFCSDCEAQIKIGSVLPKATFLLKYYRAPLFKDGEYDDFIISFPELDIHWEFATSLKNKDYSSLDTIFQINDTDFFSITKFPETGWSFKFIANTVPEYKNQIITFDEIQRKSEGAKFLGILKMDVDNLGKIFSLGLGKNRTLSRVSNLSLSLDIFFTGQINSILKPFTTTYTLFSGGDDLVLVGSWNEIVDASLKIQQEFSIYVQGNPHIHLSAGIHLFKHKFPIGMAANLVEQKLKKSKNHQEILNDILLKKNSATIFEFTAFWKDVLEALKFGEDLTRLVKENILSHSFVYKLLNIYEYHYDMESGNIKIDWLSKFVYQLKRIFEDKKNTRGGEEYYKLLFEQVPKYILFAPLWANYALLKTRKGKEGSNE